MDFSHSPRTQQLIERLTAFQEHEISPREEEFRQDLLAPNDPGAVLPVIEELKGRARAQGLWNLFLPDDKYGAGLSNVEYAPLAEVMGSCATCPQPLPFHSHHKPLVLRTYICSP